jgi:Raf kinase inhibitor-like YbhB/YbcL family protein
LAITSTAFADGGRIPTLHACPSAGGQHASPALAWNVAPAGTQTFVLLMDDLDVPAEYGPPPASHWVVFNAPSTRLSLPERVPAGALIAGGGTQGQNRWSGGLEYYGPCPPVGRTHRYQFNLYAVDISLNLQPGATRAQVLAAMQGHILSESSVIGVYQR